MVRLAPAALPLLAILLFVQPAAADRGFDAKSFTLKNGLQVVVFPNHRAPIVNHMIWYKVGSADERKGKSGEAHFLEHLMFKGTHEVGPQEFSKIVARNGGRDNAFTSYDYTAYWQTIAADKLEMVMRMEADRMHNLVLTDALVDPEREVVLEERRMRTDNNPDAKLNEVTLDALFGAQGYGIPVIGYESEIHKLNRQDELAFYKVHYAPNNAILLVAGDVDPAKVKILAEKYFGSIPAAQVPPRTRPFADRIAGPARVERRDPDVQQAQWSRNYLAPSFRAGDSAMAVPLQLLAQIMGGNETSRLYRALVDKQKLAVDTDTDYSPTALGQTTFGLSATPAAGVDMATLEKAIDEQIALLLDKGVTADELAQAQRRLLAANIYARDALGTGPRIYGAQLAIGRTVADIDRWPDEVQKVTVDQINRAARAVLRSDRGVTSLLLPAKAVGG